MNKSPCDALALSGLIARAGVSERAILTREHRVAFADFAHASCFADEIETLEGRSVILCVRDMALAAAALIELDGLARRIIVCPPGWGAEQLQSAAENGEADTVAHDRAVAPLELPASAPCILPMRPREGARPPPRLTEWVLPTSGTSGPPKLILHTFATLTAALTESPPQQWATFYDIRRYGGLQAMLRAFAGSGSLWLNSGEETIEDFLARIGAAGITHISGTPSHWRKALMSGQAGRINPEYVRLSGEIADDAALAALRERYPRARIEHQYASTEAGMGFAVGDGKAGFPASLLDLPGPVELRVVDGSLQMRSNRRAVRFLWPPERPVANADGFVDTGDMVERRGDRYIFIGRRDGVINVGGAKVHPETVEAVINDHPAVQASRVFARRNPITGAVVVADIVLNPSAGSQVALEQEIRAICRSRLPPYMTPTRLRFVPELPITEGGKLARHG